MGIARTGITSLRIWFGLNTTKPNHKWIRHKNVGEVCSASNLFKFTEQRQQKRSLPQQQCLKCLRQRTTMKATYPFLY